jgi:hypothetical protein
MKLKEALKLSAVEHLLDSDDKKVGAKRPYKNDHSTHGAAITKSSRRYLVCYSMDYFTIVYADTMKPISTDMRFYERDMSNKELIEKDDWEAL